MSPRRMFPPDDEGKVIVGIMLMCLLLVVVLVGVLYRIPRSRGAELAVPQRTRTIDAINAGRWAEMCKGAGRYDAMREAYELRKPDPCNGATKWVQ